MTQENSKKHSDFFCSPQPIWGTLTVHQHRVPCIIGVFPEERLNPQTLLFDLKIKVDLSKCIASDNIEDTTDYCLLTQICTEFAQQRGFHLLESLASTLLDEFLRRFPAVYAWISIQKTGAIPTAAYASVEMERFQNDQLKETLCGH